MNKNETVNLELFLHSKLTNTSVLFWPDSQNDSYSLLAYVAKLHSSFLTSHIYLMTLYFAGMWFWIRSAKGYSVDVASPALEDHQWRDMFPIQIFTCEDCITFREKKQEFWEFGKLICFG